MYCEKLFEGLEKRLLEKKSIDIIAEELCSTVSGKRQKIIHLIKSLKGQKYLEDNYKWLGYHVENIRNPVGVSSFLNSDGSLTSDSVNKAPRSIQKISMNTREPTDQEKSDWVNQLTSMIELLTDLETNISVTTLTRFTWKVKETNKRIKELRMFIRGK